MTKAAPSYSTGMFQFDDTTRSDLVHTAQRLQPHETALRQYLFDRLTATVELPVRLAEATRDMMASLFRAFFVYVPQGQIDVFLDQVRTLAGDINRWGLPLKNFISWFYLIEASSLPFIEQEVNDAREQARAIASLSRLMHAASAVFAQAGLEAKSRLAEAQLHPLQARNRILATLATEWSIPIICAKVADALRQLTAGDRISITLLDETGDQIQEYAVEAPGRLSSIPDPTRSPEDPTRLTVVEPSPANQESVVSVPLILRSETIGWLKLSRSRADLFSQNDLELAHFAAQHLVQAVERARLSARQWFQPEHAEAFQQIALATSSSEAIEPVVHKIIRALTQMLGADAGAVVFFDQRWTAQLGPIGYGLSDDQRQELQDSLPTFAAAAEAISTRMPISINDTALDGRIPRLYAHRFNIKSALMVPLAVKDAPVGVLLLTYTGITRAFDQEELNLARQIAQLVTLVAENALLAQTAQGEAEKFAAVFRASHEAIYLIDSSDGRILDVNAQAEEMTGYSRRELLNKRIFDVYPEEEQARPSNPWQSALDATSVSDVSDIRQARKDGSRVRVHGRTQRVLFNGKRCALVIVKELMLEEEPHQYLIRAERTEALEQLALAMRHEINNPLTGILGNVQLLLLAQDLPEGLRQRLEIIETLTLRIRDIMRRLETVKDQTIHYLDQRKMIDLRTDSAPRSETRRVLVVDDEKSIVTLLTTILTREGFEVEGVSDGPGALKQIQSQTFDHILLDIKMPGMDGTQIYRHLQKSHPEMTPKIIFITGDASAPETLDFILQTGNKYLKKPFTLQEIKAVLVPFLKNYAA